MFAVFRNGGRGLSAGCASVLILTALSCSAPASPRSRETLSVLVSPRANPGVPETLARSLRLALPDMEIDVRRGVSSLRSVEAVQHKTADVAIAGADSAYLASVGQLDDLRVPADGLRGIAVLQPRLFQLVVREGSEITKIEDLRGRRVAYSDLSASDSPTFQRVLEAFGFRPGDVTLVPLRVEERLPLLIDGKIDAAFFYGSYPIDEVSAATYDGARLLALTGDAIEHVRREYPFLRPFEIPDGTAANRNVKTIGLNLILICRTDLDEIVVQGITRAFFDALASLSVLEASFRHIDLEQASATPIPIHTGAARFYRERELAR